LKKSGFSHSSITYTWHPDTTQVVREYRICEERSDEAISNTHNNNEISALRSQRHGLFSFPHSLDRVGMNLLSLKKDREECQTSWPKKKHGVTTMWPEL